MEAGGREGGRENITVTCCSVIPPNSYVEALTLISVFRCVYTCACSGVVSFRHVGSWRSNSEPQCWQLVNLPTEPSLLFKLSSLSAGWVPPPSGLTGIPPRCPLPLLLIPLLDFTSLILLVLVPHVASLIGHKWDGMWHSRSPPLLKGGPDFCGSVGWVCSRSSPFSRWTH